MPSTTSIFYYTQAQPVSTQERPALQVRCVDAFKRLKGEVAVEVRTFRDEVVLEVSRHKAAIEKVASEASAAATAAAPPPPPGSWEAVGAIS